ncbi:MAG: hypothetical protein JWO72_516 [Caulobacteraceae bacterium]|nr:hypothetical protein [Caulobacteraceae bacterium]
MALFSIVCTDKPGALEQRVQHRPDHAAYLKTQGDILRLAGPLLDDAGQMYGSLFVVEVDDKAAAQAFSARDPFVQRGVFGEVTISGFAKTMGSWS